MCKILGVGGIPKRGSAQERLVAAAKIVGRRGFFLVF
jgi:hypothetical protein